MHFYWKSKHQRDCWDCISLILYMHHTINQREKWPKSSHFGNSVYWSILLVSFSSFVAVVFVVFSTTFKLNLSVAWHVSCSNTILRSFHVKFCLGHMYMRGKSDFLRCLPYRASTNHHHLQDAPSCWQRWRIYFLGDRLPIFSTGLRPNFLSFFTCQVHTIPNGQQGRFTLAFTLAKI